MREDERHIGGFADRDLRPDRDNTAFDHGVIVAPDDVIVGPDDPAGDKGKDSTEQPSVIIKRLRGMSGAKIEPRAGGPEVEAQTLLGRPGDGLPDPDHLIGSWGHRTDLGVAKLANLACAYAWRGYVWHRKDRDDLARADLEKAVQTIGRAQKAVKEPNGSQVETLGRDIKALDKALKE